MKVSILISFLFILIIGCKKELPLTTIDPFRQCNSKTAPELLNSIQQNKSKTLNRIELGKSDYQDSVEYYNLLGSQFIYSEDYKNAIKVLQRACFLDSSISYSFYNLAIAQSKLGNLEKAIKIISIAEELCPEKFSILNNKGYFLLELKQYQESEKYLLRAKDINKNDKKVIGNLITLYDKQHNTSKVLDLISFIDNNKLVDTSQSKLLRDIIIKYNYKIKNTIQNSH